MSLHCTICCKEIEECLVVITGERLEGKGNGIDIDKEFTLCEPCYNKVTGLLNNFLEIIREV